MRNARKQRESRRQNWREAEVKRVKPCTNCKQDAPDGHFVPPSFGESGFYVCQKEMTA